MQREHRHRIPSRSQPSIPPTPAQCARLSCIHAHESACAGAPLEVALAVVEVAMPMAREVVAAMARVVQATTTAQAETLRAAEEKQWKRRWREVSGRRCRQRWGRRRRSRRAGAMSLSLWHSATRRSAQPEIVGHTCVRERRCCAGPCSGTGSWEKREGTHGSDAGLALGWCAPCSPMM